MTDHANTYDHYHAGPDIDEPITVTLADGRVLAFVDYDYHREHPGSFSDPPTPAEVDVHEAWWVDPDGFQVSVSGGELAALHENGPDYDAILLAVQEVEEANRAEEMDVVHWEDEP